MSSATLKIKARDELHRLSEKDLGCSFHNLNPKIQSVEATKFFIREIRNPISLSISEEDLSFAVVDGANDLGCDLIHRDDGHVLIIQSKYRSYTANETPNDISHFKDILNRFRNKSLKPNSRLKEAIQEIDWVNDSFELVYICFSKMTDGVRALCDQEPNYPKDLPDLEKRCEWKYLCENDLNVELRNSRNILSGLSGKNFKLYPQGKKNQKGYSSVLLTQAGDRKSYIMTVHASQLVRAYKELGQDSIFSLNIRNFVGNTSTNTEIIKSATDSPENFFLFNNGISCLATKVTASEEALDIEGFQVINGAQTVKALVHSEKKCSWKTDAPIVLVRITEITEGYGSDGKIRDRITKFNNTQNQIKISDFRSNDSVQAYLKEQFSQIARKGKKVVYLSKRTDRIPPQTEVVRLEEFAKSVYAFLHDPTEFTGSSSFLFDDSKTGGYVKVFGDDTAVWERMPEDEFQARAAMYWIAQEFGGHLRNARELEKDPDARASLERKWLLINAAASIFKFFHPTDYKNELRKLHKGDWNLNSKSDKKSIALMRIFNAAKSGVIMSYRNSKSTNPNFEHRKWIRSKTTPSEIAAVLNNVILPMSENIGEIPK